MSDGIEHLLQGRARKRLVRFEAELSDESAHAASVEQGGCHEIRQKEPFTVLFASENHFLQAKGRPNG
jgi:hypothetical protein